MSDNPENAPGQKGQVNLMRKTIRYAAFIVGGFAVIVIAGLVVLRFVFPPEVLREMVEDRLSQATSRRITIGSVGFSILRGLAIEVGDVTIGEDPKFDSPHFARVENFYIKLRLLPLLKKRLEVRSLLLVRPELYLVTNEQGVANYGSLIPEKAVTEAADEGPEGTGFGLIFNSASLEGLTLHYDNRTVPPQQYTLSPVNIDFSLQEKGPELLRAELQALVGGISSGTLEYAVTLNRNLPMTARFSGDVRLEDGGVTLDRVVVGLAGLELNGSGQVNDFRAETPEYRVSLEGDVGDVGRVLRLVPAGLDSSLGLKRVQGDLRLSAVIQGNPGGRDSLDYRATVEFKGGKIEMDALPRPLGNVEARLTLHNRELLIEKFEAALGMDPLSLNGKIGLDDETTYNLKFVANLRLDDLPRLVPAFEGWTTGGSLRADMALSGIVEQPRSLRASGVVSGSGITLDSPELVKRISLPELSASLRGANIERMRFRIEAGNTVLELDGSLNEFTALIPASDGSLGRPVWRADLKGPLFDIKDFVAPEPSDKKTAAADKDGSFGLPLPLSYGSGSVNLGRAVLSEFITLEDARLAFTVRDSLVRFESLDATMFSGKVAGAGILVLPEGGTPSFRIDLSTSRVRAGQALSQFTSFGNYLSGLIDLAFHFEGSGPDADRILQSLSGGGSFLLNEGSVTGWPLMAGLSRWSNIAELDSLPFRHWYGQMSFVNGRARTENMLLYTRFGDWTADGSFGFDGTLDYAVNFSLNEALSRKYRSRLPGEVAGLLSGGDDRIDLAFRIRGTPASPEFRWDTSLIRQRAQDRVRSEIGRQLDRLTDRLLPENGNQNASDSAEAKPGANLQDAAKQLLRGLFNRQKEPDNP